MNFGRDLTISDKLGCNIAPWVTIRRCQLRKVGKTDFAASTTAQYRAQGFDRAILYTIDRASQPGASSYEKHFALAFRIHADLEARNIHYSLRGYESGLGANLPTVPKMWKRG